jgi:hypothetical protein
MHDWVYRVFRAVAKKRDLSSFEGTAWRTSPLGLGSWCAWRQNSGGDRIEIHPPSDGPLPWAKFVERNGKVTTYG